MKPPLEKAAMIACAFSLTLCGCGTTAGGGTTGVINMAGTWSFSVMSHLGASGTGSGTLAQNGTAISGTLALSNTPCAVSAALGGTISGTGFAGTLDENGQLVSLTGTVASDGGSASGTYTTPAGGCTNGDTGTWSGTRTFVSGNFVGELSPADRNPVGVSLTLKQDGQEVSGAAAFRNSVCLSGPLSLSGNVSGSTVTLNGDGVELQGTLAADGNSLQVNSIVTGNCASESGAGTLAKVP